MMTALLLDGYCQRVHPSRRLARACKDRVDLVALTARQKPDFRTISEFRKRHLGALQPLLVQVLRVCQQAKLVTLGRDAPDGTRIKANAGKHQAMSCSRTEKAEPALDAAVGQWLKNAEKTDAREDAEYGADRRGDELPDWVAGKQKRLAKLREVKAALEVEARRKSQRMRGIARVSGPAPGSPPPSPPVLP